MKLTMVVLAGALGLGIVTAAPVQAGTVAPAKVEKRGAELKEEVKALRADIEAVRTAHQAKDKAAVKVALEKLRADWEALPEPVKKEIEEKHPAFFKTLKERLAAKGKKGTI